MTFATQRSLRLSRLGELYARPKHRLITGWTVVGGAETGRAKGIHRQKGEKYAFVYDEGEGKNRRTLISVPYARKNPAVWLAHARRTGLNPAKPLPCRRRAQRMGKEKRRTPLISGLSGAVMAPPARLELTTFRLGGGPSILVRYGGMDFSWRSGKRRMLCQSAFACVHLIIRFFAALVKPGARDGARLRAFYKGSAGLLQLPAPWAFSHERWGAIAAKRARRGRASRATARAGRGGLAGGSWGTLSGRARLADVLRWPRAFERDGPAHKSAAGAQNRGKGIFSAARQARPRGRICFRMASRPRREVLRKGGGVDVDCDCCGDAGDAAVCLGAVPGRGAGRPAHGGNIFPPSGRGAGQSGGRGRAGDGGRPAVSGRREAGLSPAGR